MRTHVVSLESWYGHFFSPICCHSLLSSVALPDALITKTSTGINSCRGWCFKTNWARHFNSVWQHVQICGLRVLRLPSQTSLVDMLVSVRQNAWVFSVVVLTGISTAEEPGMVGSGRVPGMEAGRGCLCLFRRCSSEDREPGKGLQRNMHKDFQRSSSPETGGFRDNPPFQLIWDFLGCLMNLRQT